MRITLSALLLILASLPIHADDTVRSAIATLLSQSTGNVDARPFVASAPNGATIVAWMNNPGAAGLASVNVSILDRDGNIVTAPFALPMGTRVPWNCSVASTRDRFMVVYDAQPNSATAERDVYYVIFDQAGTSLTNGQVNAPSGLDDNLPSVDGNLNGEFAVVWRQVDFSVQVTPGVFASVAIRVRRFNQTGTPIDPTAVRVDTQSFGLQFGVNVGYWNSRLVVAWHDGPSGGAQTPTNSPDGWGQGIVGRWFNAGASITPITPQTVLSTTTALDQFEPIVEVSHNNQCIIGWCGDTTISHIDAYVRRFDDLGNPIEAMDNNLTPGDTVNSQFLMDVGMTADGESVATWMSQPITVGEPDSRPGYARLDRNGNTFDSGLVETGGSSIEDMAFSRIGVDEYGNFQVAYRTQREISSTIIQTGVRHATFKRQRIGFFPATASAGSGNLITVDSPSDANQVFVLAASLGQGPLPVDTRSLKLSDDFVLQWSVFGPNFGIFRNFIGVLDANGVSPTINQPTLVIPPDPSLTGFSLFFSFVTDGPSSPSGFGTIADTYELRVL